jgi:hypothetical protein
MSSNAARKESCPPEETMATVTHGMITIEVAELLALPEQAGKLSTKEMQKIPKPPRGIGRLCAQAADAIERAGETFSPPPGVTPQSLREAGERADGIDQYLIDLDFLREKVRQANLLFDADAWKQARRMNDSIKAQMRHDPALALIFQKVLEAFAVFASKTADQSQGATEEQPAEPAPGPAGPADAPPAP